ncbi:energy transducer TonB [Rudaea cellulosilytica]|uniref:energy transducer TonB n=1 Tax=Rudaea cellulosilytica TaxID=540746 RepID=UPI0003A988F9|nr:energy transducer TonB [Rudaea cellulosilytica]
MTALVLGSVPSSALARRPLSLSLPRISAWSGTFSLHLMLALLLLVPPVAMQLQRISNATPSEPPPYVRPPEQIKPEPALPQPPIKKRIAPTPPPVPRITITAPIAQPVPMPPTSKVDSIAPPADRAVPTTPLDSGVADASPSALGYGTQTKIPYPPIALRNHTEGTVILRVLVGEDGSVKDIEIDKSSGSHELDRAAREGVMKWKFKPGMRGGVAYAGWARVPISFTLP